MRSSVSQNENIYSLPCTNVKPLENLAIFRADLDGEHTTVHHATIRGRPGHLVVIWSWDRNVRDKNQRRVIIHRTPIFSTRQQAMDNAVEWSEAELGDFTIAKKRQAKLDKKAAEERAEKAKATRAANLAKKEAEASPDAGKETSKTKQSQAAKENEKSTDGSAKRSPKKSTGKSAKKAGNADDEDSGNESDPVQLSDDEGEGGSGQNEQNEQNESAAGSEFEGDESESENDEPPKKKPRLEKGASAKTTDKTGKKGEKTKVVEATGKGGKKGRKGGDND